MSKLYFLEAFPEVFIWQAQAAGSMRRSLFHLSFSPGEAGLELWLVTGPDEPGPVLSDSSPEHPVSLLWASKLGLLHKIRIFSC